MLHTQGIPEACSSLVAVAEAFQPAVEFQAPVNFRAVDTVTGLWVWFREAWRRDTCQAEALAQPALGALDKLALVRTNWVRKLRDGPYNAVGRAPEGGRRPWQASDPQETGAGRLASRQLATPSLCTPSVPNCCLFNRLIIEPL